jgi:hypothetical protein
VDKATGGKLKIQVHANASLFKANEIKRAVQGGQAPIGEVLLVNFEKREPDLRRRRHPLPRSQLPEARKLATAPEAAAWTSCSPRRA